MAHHYQDLINVFNQCFAEPLNTRLVKGGDEPLYLPATEAIPFHQIFFANGFFSSALHECAHWFIAGEKRHLLVDFGYWYEPDGRSAEQQKLFQRVEVKPQAIEWILSQATGYRFRVSNDNLNGLNADDCLFKRAIHEQVLKYCQIGLPSRAEKFRVALCQFYKNSVMLKEDTFKLADLM